MGIFLHCLNNNICSHFAGLLSTCFLSNTTIELKGCHILTPHSTFTVVVLRLCVCLFQVSHHPPAAAHHVISDRGWTLRQEITVASKFRGKYLSIMPLGKSQSDTKHFQRAMWSGNAVLRCVTKRFRFFCVGVAQRDD